MITYRLLPPDEYEHLAEFCARNGVPQPKSETSIVAVAEKDGQVIFCHALHLQLHADNFCRDKDYTGWVDWRKVWACLESTLPKDVPFIIYTYPSLPNCKRCAEILGFEVTDYPLMMKTYNVKKGPPMFPHIGPCRWKVSEPEDVEVSPCR